MIAPAMAPPITPAAIPGPHQPGPLHPHPRACHWAELSVVEAAKVPATAATATKPANEFFISISSMSVGGERGNYADPLPLKEITKHGITTEFWLPSD
jgi:hypothetical protein